MVLLVKSWPAKNTTPAPYLPLQFGYQNCSKCCSSWSWETSCTENLLKVGSCAAKICWNHWNNCKFMGWSQTSMKVIYVFSSFAVLVFSATSKEVAKASSWVKTVKEKAGVKFVIVIKNKTFLCDVFVDTMRVKCLFSVLAYLNNTHKCFMYMV